MSAATLGLALLASVLSVLSPCVLPLLPIVLGTAARQHPRRPRAAAPGSNWAGFYADSFPPGGLAGQFGLGLLLGAVWSPCVGPTLGAASVLAAKSEDLVQVALTMLAFGIGAALPLMLLGLLSREAMMRWRGRLMETGKAGKALLGVLLVGVGLLVGCD